MEKTSLIEQLKILGQIQEIDLQADQIRTQREALPKELDGLKQQVVKAEATLSLKNQAVQEKQKAISQLDAAVQMNQDRQLRSQKKLEAVGNTKEFQAATKESDQLKRLNDEMAQSKAKLLKEMEPLQEAVKKATEGALAAKALVEKASQELGGRDKNLDQELGTLTQKRGEILSQGVLPTLLTRYNRVREARQGRGISGTGGGRCQACNIMLPPQLVNIVQKGAEICACPSCSRILVREPPPETSPPG